jgi:hypothetical protein
MGSFTPHRGTHCFISNDTPISWASSLLRGTQRFISVSERTTYPTHGLPHTGAHNIPSPSQGGTTHPAHGLPHPTQGTQRSISASKRNHTPNSWASSPHTGEHNVPSPSQRGTTHPTHGISLRMTHSVCVLEDVSHSCNHQHLPCCFSSI